MHSQIPNILFVTNVLGPFLHHRRHLVNAAREEGLIPIVVAMLDDPKEDVSGFEFRNVSMKLYRFSILTDMFFFMQVLYLILTRRPTVLHLVTLKPYLYGGLAGQLARIFGWRGKTVITVAGLGRLFSDAWGTSAKGRALQSFIYPFLVTATKGATVFFETSHDKSVWIDKGIIKEQQARVINGTGLDLRKFAFTRRDPLQVSINILFAGRLMRSKGLDVVMRAAEHLKGVDHVTFSIAGVSLPDDDDAVSEEELIAMENITYLGVVRDMPSLLSRTDVVLLPSRYNEGVPRILIEAAASGCVIAATPFPGSKILIEDGRTGLLIKGDTIGDQARYVADMVSHLQQDGLLRCSLGEAASDFVRKGGFDAADIAKQFVGVYVDREFTKGASV
jgi:glycosyltransferase involved in cell wall biosynthesis